jgi:hypothetical protein
LCLSPLDFKLGESNGLQDKRIGLFRPIKEVKCGSIIFIGKPCKNNQNEKNLGRIPKKFIFRAFLDLALLRGLSNVFLQQFNKKLSVTACSKLTL